MDDYYSKLHNIKTRNIYSIGFASSIVLIIVGTLFKIQHWPYGLYVSITGFSLLGLTGVMRYLTNSNKDLMRIMSSLFIVLYALQGILKQLRSHWYAELTICLFLIGAAWITVYIVRMLRDGQTLQLGTKNILFGLGAILIVMGAILKIQHYPGSSMLFLVGFCLILISCLADLRGRKE